MRLHSHNSRHNRNTEVKILLLWRTPGLIWLETGFSCPMWNKSREKWREVNTLTFAASKIDSKLIWMNYPFTAKSLTSKNTIWILIEFELNCRMSIDCRERCRNTKHLGVLVVCLIERVNEHWMIYRSYYIYLKNVGYAFKHFLNSVETLSNSTILNIFSIQII